LTKSASTWSEGVVRRFVNAPFICWDGWSSEKFLRRRQSRRALVLGVVAGLLVWWTLDDPLFRIAFGRDVSALFAIFGWPTMRALAGLLVFWTVLHFVGPGQEA